MKKLLLLVSFVYWATGVNAQVNADSLWGVWTDSNLPDTTRMRAIQQLAWSLMYSNPDSTALLARLGLEYAQKIGNTNWEGKALNTLGCTHQVKGEYAQALKNFEKSLSAQEAANDIKGASSLYNNIGMLYRGQGNNPKALEYFEKYLQIAIKLGNDVMLSAAYNNLGTLYHDQNNSPRALEYYKKGLTYVEKTKDKYDLALAFNNIGGIYYNQHHYDQALEQYQKSLELRQEINDQRGEGIMYNGIGLIYQSLEKYDLAQEYFSKAIAIQKKLEDKPELTSTYYSLGTLFLGQKIYATAISWCAKSLALSDEIGALRPARNACNCLYEAYKGQGNSRKALAWHERFVTLEDSLQKEETNRHLDQMEFEKEMLTDSLVREEEKQHIKIAYQQDLNKKTQTRNLILVVSLAILVLALVFLSRMFYFQKRSEGLQDKTQQLEKQQLINEIDLLKTQVNPHFLFNSLSILSSLVHVNADLSEQFIEQLARSYRYILEQKDQALVTLRTELEFIHSYAFLLKIRFDNKFDLRINLLEDQLDKYRIAPLTLQLLVENAVKHNRMSTQDPLIVEVLIEDDFLIVKNQLRMRPQRESSTGTGLNNIINRYALLTDRSVKAGECEDEFIVRVPLLNANS